MMDYAVLGVITAFFAGIFALYVRSAREGGRQEGENSAKDAIIRKNEALNDKIASIQGRTPNWRASLSKLRERSANRPD